MNTPYTKMASSHPGEVDPELQKVSSWVDGTLGQTSCERTKKVEQTEPCDGVNILTNEMYVALDLCVLSDTCWRLHCAGVATTECTMPHIDASEAAMLILVTVLHSGLWSKLQLWKCSKNTKIRNSNTQFAFCKQCQSMLRRSSRMEIECPVKKLHNASS